MSLIITIHTNEGIVMASDSRTTFSKQDFSPLPGGKGAIITNQQGIHYSDTTYKTFVASNNAGISTCGDAAIRGKPIAGYIEDFIHNNIAPKTRISEIPQMLMEKFRAFSPVPNIIFHVAGYELEEEIPTQKFYRVFIFTEQIIEIDVLSQGAAWNGETEILSRIISTYWTENRAKEGEVTYVKHDAPQIPWNFFSLQDAIDFSTYAMKTTIETMRFQERPKTVGGPIDILVIKPAGARWIARKELHAN